MANLTDEQKKDMQNTAGFSSESLAERLNQELARASSLRDDMEALAPSQHRTAEMIGDVSNLPAGMSPTQARLRGTAAGTAFAATQSRYGQANVLEVLGQMMKLQQEKEDSSIRQRQMNIAEQQFAQEMAANGMVWDKELNTVRGMTDEERKSYGVSSFASISDAEAVSLLKSATGLGDKLALGSTEKERGARAKELLGKLETGESLTYKDLLSSNDAKKVDAYQNMINAIDEAIGIIDKEGKASGFWQGLFRKTRGSQDWLGEDTVKLEKLLSDIGAGKAFGDAGKALTKEEKEIVEGYIVQIKKGETQNKTILNQLREEMIGQIYSNAGDFSPTVNNTGDEVIMTDQSGQQYKVPTDKIEEAKKMGWKE